jgi:hypothetical protein
MHSFLIGSYVCLSQPSHAYYSSCLYALKLISDSSESSSRLFLCALSYLCNPGPCLRGWGFNEACGVNRYVQRCDVLCGFIKTIAV